jgi:transposase
VDLDIEAAELPHQFTPKQRFSYDEKLRILQVWDRADEAGMKTALCRRLGIRPATVASWAKQRREGTLVRREDQHRSAVVQRDQAARLKLLAKENEASKRDLARAEGAVEALGKASELLTALAKSSKPTLPPRVPTPPPSRARPGK